MAARISLTPSGSRVRAYLEGGPELDAALKRLEKGLADELVKEALLAGAEVIAEAWRNSVPVDEGDYRNSIAASARAGKRGATAIVTVSRRYDGGEGDHYRDIMGRAVVLEFGTSGRGRATTGRGHGYRAAKPSARPAFDSSVARATDAIERKLVELVKAATG